MRICCVFTPEQARTRGPKIALGAVAPSLAVAASVAPLCARMFLVLSLLLHLCISAVVDILMKSGKGSGKGLRLRNCPGEASKGSELVRERLKKAQKWSAKGIKGSEKASKS